MSTVSGVYLDSQAPRFLLYAVPALLSVVALYRARWLRALVAASPDWWIPALQTLRLGGGASLFAAWSIGLTPWGLARTAGTGDLLVGLGAAGAGWRCCLSAVSAVHAPPRGCGMSSAFWTFCTPSFAR